jgi:SagB-type dehydrogenase family enzyme
LSHDALETVFTYHQATKHALNRFADGPGYLDWATQPDPFRRYARARLIPLRRVPPGDAPDYAAGFNPGIAPPAPRDLGSISRLFFDSLALSAWKEYRGSRWALRVNPSSGNLHPTEGYLLCGPTPGLTDAPIVAHYAPREHALEVRAILPAARWDELAAGLPTGALLVGLTSIHWREAWKYGQRAYRYCQHDVGHALAALSIAAAGLGWHARLLDGLGTDQVAALLGVADQTGPEAEHPDCLLAIYPKNREVVAQDGILRHNFPAETIERFGELAWEGQPNTLSPSHAAWDWVDAAAEAARKPAGQESGDRDQEPSDRGRGSAIAERWDAPPRSLRRIIHQRRSAQEMDGRTALDRETFYRILARTLPGPGRVPFDTSPSRPYVNLVLFVHRVTGLTPGLYLLVRSTAHAAGLRQALKADFAWETPPGCPPALPFYRLQTGDARDVARRISCGQDIAADGCFSLGMIAEFERPLTEDGAWRYPRLFWECGMIGQVLYLEAEAAGVRGTGIGCFFDDGMHGLLGLKDARYQSLYHFTVGGPLEDTRLTTLPAYGEG